MVYIFSTFIRNFGTSSYSCNLRLPESKRYQATTTIHILDPKNNDNVIVAMMECCYQIFAKVYIHRFLLIMTCCFWI